MTVLNVLSTNSITAAATEYQTVQTGYYRVSATSASTVSFNDGPAIQILAGTAVLLKGSKPGQAQIVKATDAATAVYTLGHNVGEYSNTHPFSVGDWIAVVANNASPALDAAFLSAGTAGKKVTAVTPNTITTDVDSSAAPADYTYAGANNQALVQRAIKIVAGAADIVVEEVQVVGG